MVNGGSVCTLPKRTLADYYIRLQSDSPQYFPFGAIAAYSVAFRINPPTVVSPLFITYPEPNGPAVPRYLLLTTKNVFLCCLNEMMAILQ
jgi:hypothetical protein